MLPAPKFRPGPPTDSMPQHYDSLEARDPEERERLLMTALSGQVTHAKRRAPGWARILAEVDPAGVTSRAALAKLPVTRKSDLVELQKAERPLGGLNATLAQLGKVFVSPGPIYEPERRGRDWCRAPPNAGAPFRFGDRARRDKDFAQLGERCVQAGQGALGLLQVHQGRFSRPRE